MKKFLLVLTLAFACLFALSCSNAKSGAQKGFDAYVKSAAETQEISVSDFKKTVSGVDYVYVAENSVVYGKVSFSSGSSILSSLAAGYYKYNLGTKEMTIDSVLGYEAALAIVNNDSTKGEIGKLK